MVRKSKVEMRMTLLATRVPEDLLIKLKVTAAQHRTTVQAIVNEALTAWLKRGGHGTSVVPRPDRSPSSSAKTP